MSEDTIEQRYNRIVDACRCKACGCSSLSLVDMQTPLHWNCDGCKRRWPVDSQPALKAVARHRNYANAIIELVEDWP